MHPEDKWRVSKGNFKKRIHKEEVEHFLAMVGVPDGKSQKVLKRFFSFRAIGEPLEEVSTMEDGNEFIGDSYHLRVIHTPGHSPGSTCLYESHRRSCLAGTISLNILRLIP